MSAVLLSIVNGTQMDLESSTVSDASSQALSEVLAAQERFGPCKAGKSSHVGDPRSHKWAARPAEHDQVQHCSISQHSWVWGAEEMHASFT